MSRHFINHMDKREKAEAGARGQKGQSKGMGESMFSGEGATGIKISAKGVLLMSLAFISIVVVLHFIDKLSA